MVDRAEQFVDQFTKVIEMIKQKAPTDIAFGIFVYARDSQTRNDQYPDGVIHVNQLSRGGLFDKYSMIQMVKDHFKSF